MSNEEEILTKSAIAPFLSATCFVAGEPISDDPATTHRKSNSALAYLKGARSCGIAARGNGEERAQVIKCESGKVRRGDLPLPHYQWKFLCYQEQNLLTTAKQSIIFRSNTPKFRITPSRCPLSVVRLSCFTGKNSSKVKNHFSP